MAGPSKEQVLQSHCPAAEGGPVVPSTVLAAVSTHRPESKSVTQEIYNPHREIKPGKLWKQNESRTLSLVLSSKRSMNLGPGVSFFLGLSFPSIKSRV